MTNPLAELLVDLPAADGDARAAVTERAGSVLRPPGALARLDEIAVHVGAWHGSAIPRIEHPSIVVFAADHGVAAAGVSAFPSDVTAAMLSAVEAGKATINAFGRATGSTVAVVDVGVGRPTGDIRVESAMDTDRFAEAVGTGAAAADRAADEGADLLVVGELGIGNTTAAAAVVAAITGAAPADVVGRGTGVDDDGLVRKIDAVTAAVGRVGSPAASISPADVMREVGGAELAAMAAAIAQARRRRVPVVLDGFPAGSAALVLAAEADGSIDHCLAGHRSAELGHHLVLDHLGLTPIVDLDLRLGEGSGAAIVIPIVAMACAGVTEVPTFTEWFGRGFDTGPTGGSDP